MAKAHGFTHVAELPDLSGVATKKASLGNGRVSYRAEGSKENRVLAAQLFPMSADPMGALGEAAFEQRQSAKAGG